MNTFISTGFPNHRGRRLRKKKGIRSLISESSLIPDNLVMPYFIRDDDDDDYRSIVSGLKRFSINILSHVFPDFG